VIPHGNSAVPLAMRVCLIVCVEAKRRVGVVGVVGVVGARERAGVAPAHGRTHGRVAPSLALSIMHASGMPPSAKEAPSGPFSVAHRQNMLLLSCSPSLSPPFPLSSTALCPS
jgi:hypothetical protein